MSKPFRLLTIALLMSLLCVQASLACRYNVRETGFVYLGLQPYYLYCYIDANTTAETVSQIQSIAEETLANSSIRFELVPADAEPPHPAIQYMEANRQTSLPSAVLLSPRQSVLPLHMPGPGPGFADNFQSLLTGLVSSPIRDTLVRKAAENYAAVLLIEGSDSTQNDENARAIEQAIESVTRQMKFMPKQITSPPVLVRMPADRTADERILLWSLGADQQTHDRPCAAVIYGRARWIGPLLAADQISSETVASILAVVGADCECGFDRTLLRGTILPAQWNDQIDTLVAQDLGFDPEDPIVMMEVGQILHLNSAAWPSVAARRAERDAGRTAVYEPPVPFVEDTVQPEPAPVETTAAAKNAVRALAVVAALVVATGLLIMSRRAALSR